MQPNDRHKHQLGVWWARLNRAVFGGALLVPPKLVLDSALEVGAVWDPTQATIRVSHPFVRKNQWLTVLEVLKREMAHQYVTDVIGTRDETVRCEAHRMICDRLGVCAALTQHARDAVSATVLVNIKAQLECGDSSTDRSALLLAQSLTKTPSIVAEGSEEFWARAVGSVSTTVEPYERKVASILVRLLDVDCTWADSLCPGGQEGRQLEVVGRLQHVRAAERLRRLLLEEAGRRWTKRASPGSGGWINFLDRVVEGFERVLPDDSDADGSLQTRDVELIKFCARRHRNRAP